MALSPSQTAAGWPPGVTGFQALGRLARCEQRQEYVAVVKPQVGRLGHDYTP